MATASKRLAHILARAYTERSSGHHGALKEFKDAHSDHELMAHARAEHDRLAKLEQTLGCPLQMRCYSSAQHLAFLRKALTG